MKKQIFMEVAFVALVAILLLGAMTNEEFGNTGNKFIATETGVGSMLTSFTATDVSGLGMDVEVLSVYFKTSVDGGTFTIDRDSATSTTFDYNHLTQDMSSDSDLVWPTNDAHYFLAKEDHWDFAQTLVSTTTWALEIHYERR